MALYQIYSDMHRDFQIAEDQLLHFAATKPSTWASTSFDLADIFYLEGWMSFVWQTWCTFCRASIVSSTLGATTGAGVITVPVMPHITDKEVSGAAIRLARGQSLAWTANTVLRHEPTWGDVDKLHDVISGIAPTNSGALLSGVAAGSTAAKAIQTIRNAAAHRNIQTMTNVLALRTSYIAFPVTDPLQSLFWIASSREYLAIDALNELTTAGFVAIS